MWLKDGALYAFGLDCSPETGEWDIRNPYETQILEIRPGRPNDKKYITVYKQGDEIPPYSGEEEHFWQKQVEARDD